MIKNNPFQINRKETYEINKSNNFQIIFQKVCLNKLKF